MGSCEVFGENLLTMRSRDKLNFRAHNIGFVFQAFNLLPSLNAAENVSVPLIINGMKRVEAERKAITVLEHVGLGERWTVLTFTTFRRTAATRRNCPCLGA